MDQANQTMELTGTKNLTELYEWFGDMTDEQIESACSECWPADDTAELSIAISEVMSNIAYLKEFHPGQF